MVELQNNEEILEKMREEKKKLVTLTREWSEWSE